MPNTTPEGLWGPPKPEHNCKPLKMGDKLVATCDEHWMQAPALRNKGTK